MNFSAGPAVTLPLPALERAQREAPRFSGTGMSVMKLSPTAVRPHHEAVARRGARPPSRSSSASRRPTTCIFLPGGASQQFTQVPLNFLATRRTSRRLRHQRSFRREGRSPRRQHRGHELTDATDPRHGEHHGVRREAPSRYVRAPAAGRAPCSMPDASFVHVHVERDDQRHQFANEPGESFPDFGGIPVGLRHVERLHGAADRREPVTRFIYAGAQKNIRPERRSSW